MNQEHNPPSGFILYEYVREYAYPAGKISGVWDRLQRRETFTKSQIFPYRVEFASSSQEGAFEAGELNIHHGPLLSVHGAICDVTTNYRGLNYFYGSYVLSFRLVRPVKLEFFREGDKLKLKLKSFIRPWFKPFWNLGNFILWSIFRITL